MRSLIPSGWYRVCSLLDIKSRQTLQIALLNGVVFIQYNQFHKIEVHYAPNIHASRIKLPSSTHDKWIFVWFSHGYEPDFNIIPKLSLFQKGWSKPIHLRWVVRSTAIEIAENAVDMAHFTSVHVYKTHPKILDFHLNQHQMTINYQSCRKVLNSDVPVQVELSYQGLGFVESNVKTPKVEVRVLYTPVPIDTNKIDILLSFSFKKSWNPIFNTILSFVLARDIKTDFEKDIPIWENKIVHQYPILCASDGPIMPLRKWASQFYEFGKICDNNV